MRHTVWDTKQLRGEIWAASGTLPGVGQLINSMCAGWAPNHSVLH